MRQFRFMLAIFGLIAAGCTLDSGDPEETLEMIRILEEEDIDSISTSHSQNISINLKDGRHFEGKYVYRHAGKYSEDVD